MLRSGYDKVKCFKKKCAPLAHKMNKAFLYYNTWQCKKIRLPKVSAILLRAGK